MDGTIDDFFNEIDQIAPPKSTKPEPVWQECYDKSTGFAYYWNMKTDEVSWQKPTEYKSWKAQKDKPKNEAYIPPKSSPLFPSAALMKNTKIYKIGKDTRVVPAGASKPLPIKPTVDIKKAVKPSGVLTKNNSEEKRIILISSYGDDSDSENEDKQATTKPENSINEKIKEEDTVKKETEKKDITGFSLLASYGDSEDEEEKAKENVSTLFPAPKPIDVNQFSEKLETKPFQRKRRIEVELTTKKPRLEEPEPPAEDAVARKGLGFKRSEDEKPKKVEYPGFQRGGVMFAKSEVVNPIEPVKKVEAETAEPLEKIEETRHMLNEKLNFLCEGRDSASPVQIMIIQMETLYEAMKAGGLTKQYLHKWLKETCEALIKLEKDAAPSGWLLQWDRVNKRYYYQNQHTGETQWEYPQPDVVSADDAMDISTTPPPPPIEPPETKEVVPQPPPPPRIKNPTPPPPPVISHKEPDETPVRTPDIIIPLPPLPPEKQICSEPLPPGVDVAELHNDAPMFKENTTVNSDLGSVLDSFYSDIAALESQNEPTVSPVPPEEVSQVAEVQTKKKKKKVKLVQGLAMKKKGVSKLVERWKSVQKDY